MARRDDPRPPIEVVGADRDLSSTQRVASRPPGRPTTGLLVVGVVVALVLVGLALGGGGDEGPDEAADASTTTSPTTTTTPPRSATSRPATTTTTIPVGPVLGAPVAAQLLAYGGSWTLVDLDTGIRRELDDLAGSEPYSVLPAEGGVVAVHGTEVRYHPIATSAEDDGPPVVLGEGNRVLPAGRIDRVWMLDGGAYSPTPDVPLRATLVDLTGHAHATLELGSDDVGLATSQGLVLGRGGRVYLVDEGGPRPIAAGSLVGTVGDAVVVQQCDDRAECALWLRDLDGTARRLDAAEVSVDFGSSVLPSPDGRFVVVSYGRDSTTADLFSASGAHLGDLDVAQSEAVSGFPVWLPGDAGLIAPTPAGGPRWIRQGPAGWVSDVPPALEGLSAEVLVVIPR